MNRGEEMTTTKNITVPQFMAYKTRSYKGRYLHLLGERNCYTGDPASAIPESDHSFTLGPYLVSRPYGAFKRNLRDLLDWADLHGLELWLDAPSSWHPSTLVIRAFREDWREEFKAAARAHGDAFEQVVSTYIYRQAYADIDRVYHGSRKPRESGIYILNTTRSVHSAYYSTSLWAGELDTQTVLSPAPGFSFEVER